jgi:hypothetical protein
MILKTNYSNITPWRNESLHDPTHRLHASFALLFVHGLKEYDSPRNIPVPCTHSIAPPGQRTKAGAPFTHARCSTLPLRVVSQHTWLTMAKSCTAHAQRGKLLNIMCHYSINPSGSAIAAGLQPLSYNHIMLSIRRPFCQRAPTLKKAKVQHPTAIAAATNTPFYKTTPWRL